MQIFSLMSQKGGAGKTTLAVHLAVAIYQQGGKVALIDTDPQQSACVWCEARKGGSPDVSAVRVAQLEEAIGIAKNKGFDFLVIDTAPNAGPDAVDVARVSGKVIIPVRPSVFDLSAAKRTIEIVRRATTRALLVLSACPARAPEVEMAREALTFSGIPVAKTTIGDRRPFARAVQTGKAVIEFEPTGKAAGEINQLLKEILS